MKRLSYLFTALSMFLFTILNSVPIKTTALGPNLLANNSVETASTANTTLPDKWTHEKWGTNTATFTYPTTGHTGTRSVKVNMTAHTNGDAKWIADAVAVTPGQSYTYSDWYQSSVITNIVVAEITSAGAYSYKELATAPKSTTWKQYSATFIPATTTAKVQIFHLIKRVGNVTIDDASLALTNTTPPPTDTTAPTVAVSAPAANATVSGTVAVNATATDNVGVTKVEFSVDGGAVLATDTASPYSYNLNTASLSNGVHTITATAYDAANNKTSSTVSVTVNNIVTPPADTTVPTVSITAPAANATVSGTVSVTANAGDNVGVTKVEFSIDGGAVAATSTTSPYGFNWASTAVADGSHTITATAYDAANNKATNSVAVTVKNTVTPPPVDTENLLLNPSFATSNGVLPANWSNNKWGTNTTTFTYETTGRTDGRSATVNTTAYTSGDAKWFHDPVTVTPSKNYLYRDYYKSTATTRIVAAYQDAAGNYTYQDLVSVPAATAWTQVSASFTTPANATKVTIYHLIDQVGKLTIDDTELVVAPQTPPSTTIPANASVESGAATPTDWQSSSWGNNSANFQYVSGDAHEGTKSVKVTISNYVDGDAKWFFTPTSSIQAGKEYRFTNWYKGTVAPHVVALYILPGGVEQYVGLPSPLTVSSTTWTRYSDTFSVPTNATAVSIFMYVSSNGWIQTDDYSITNYTPNGFSRPLVSLTFDDGHEDNVTSVLPVLNQYGYKSTQCYATSFIEGQSQAVINGVLAFKNAGHEICSHTVTHPFLTSLNATALDYELSHAKAYLESLIGEPVVNFASPYGDYNATVNAAIGTYYQSHRTVDEGFNSKDNYDLYRLRVQNILDTTTAAQVQAWVDQAIADKTWLILVYHRVATNPGPYDTTPALFNQQLQAIQQSGIAVVTMQQGIVETRAQLP